MLTRRIAERLRAKPSPLAQRHPAWLRAALSSAALLFAASASAVTLNLTFIEEGKPFPGLGTPQNPINAFPPSISAKTFPGPPPGKKRGDREDKQVLNTLLRRNVECAAQWWQAALQDNFILDIAYGWYDVRAEVPTAVGLFNSTMRDNTGRTVKGVIRFDYNAVTHWFLDATPPSSLMMGNQEYATFHTEIDKLGTANDINIARFYTAQQGGPAADRIDLFSVALHEFGHALGVDQGTQGFMMSIDAQNNVLIVSQDRPAGSGTQGARIPVFTGGMNLDNGGHLNLENAVMFPEGAAGRRFLLSAADILAAAQASDFTMVDLNPTPIKVDEVPVIPEPSGVLLFGLGGLLLAARVWRHRRQAVP